MQDESKPRPQTQHDLPYAPPRATFGAAPMTLATPEVIPTDGPLRIAPRSSRFFARMIDGVLLILALIPAFLYGYVSKPDDSLIFGLLALGAFFLVSAIQWYLIATRGQSVGKRFLQIKIVRDDGTPVGFLHGVLLREWVPGLVSMIPLVGRFIWILDPIFIFRLDHRCLHDQIAGTRVIELELTERGFSSETP